MDKLEAKPCAGKEDKFKEKHGPSGIAIFFAVIIPFLLAGGVGYWVWKNWANKFGQIRLGEQGRSSPLRAFLSTVFPSFHPF